MDACTTDGATPEAFRRVMGSFATGVAVLTTATDGEPHGMTINSLTSVSLDPLIVLVCIVRQSRTGAAIRERGRFAINLLAADQEQVSRRFVAKTPARFLDGDLAHNPWNVPLLDGRLAHLVCDVHHVQEMGDHDVVYGRVLHCEACDGQPLVFWRGAYSMLGDQQARAA